LAFGGVPGARGQVSPFEDVDWKAGAVPRVMVGGEWWEPVAIAGVPFGEIVGRARDRYGDEASVQKRIDEDLLEVLEMCGATAPGDRVALELRPVRGGDLTVIPDATMTRENRMRLWAKRAGADALAERAAEAAAVRAVLEVGLDSAETLGVLYWAEVILRSHHSYSAARAIDLAGELSREREMLGRGATAADCVRAIKRVLARSGDGHARVYGMWALAAAEAEARSGALPVALMPLELEEGGRVVAIRPEGVGLVDPAHPFVAAIDGIEIERWLQVATEVSPGGSAQSRRHWACRTLGRPGWIRERLGLGPAAAVTLELASADGDRSEVTVGLTDDPTQGYHKPPVRSLPLGTERFACIPIDSMWDAEVAGVARPEFAAVGAALERACEAEGVLIDIRGNTGGSRDLLHLVASYVMAPDAEPVVYSVARALMWPGRQSADVEKSFEGRYLFPPESARWNESERQAIDSFLGRWTPEIELPNERFGPARVSVLSPGGVGGGRLAGKPVVVLMDERCISASDVFLAAMKELPGVTLVGRPSRGASGMSEEYDFGEGLTLKLSTMVSFMPDGRVFDWHGVAPDVAVELAPEDFTRAGPDTALEAATALLRDEIARRGN
jgi:hypothetical protein